MKKIVLYILILMFTITLIGCQDKNQNTTETTEESYVYNYGEEQMLKYLWDTNVIYNETVVLVENNGIISGSLLFEPIEIISVRDYTLNREYSKDEYYFEGNKIMASSVSTMPYFTANQSIGAELKDGYALSTSQALNSNETILFTEGVGIVMHQISVTYRYSGVWDGPIQEYQGQYLQNFLSKLTSDEEINLVIYGDSISTGCNSSSKLGISPFQKDFANLVTGFLKSNYNEKINLINTSLGGALSSWGKDSVESNVISYNPDLVIIGFGMNDGSWNVSKEIYRYNIEMIIKSIQKNNENTDILLMATILANPDSIQNQGQSEYLGVLKSLSNQYNVGVVDMTSISEYLFETKKSLDIYANNINHPGDFVTRIYAMNILKSIIEE